MYKRKNVIKDTNVKAFLNQFKGKKPSEEELQECMDQSRTQPKNEFTDHAADISNVLYAKSLILKG